MIVYAPVAIANIIDENRQRKDLKDVQQLAQSIRRFGLIQPIVLQDVSGRGPTLVAGGRRLEAVRQLGWRELNHGKDFIWRDEPDGPDSRLRLQAIELEENLKREDLTWSEEVAAKLTLLRMMQSIHGQSKGFGAGKTGVNDSGFGIRALAAMLGENPSTTSRDIDLAEHVERYPSMKLALMPSKADAMRKVGVVYQVAGMQQKAAQTSVVKIPIGAAGTQSGSATVGLTPAHASIQSGVGVSPALISAIHRQWMLYEGKFQDHIHLVDSNSVDLVCTDLPYAVNFECTSTANPSHSAGLGGFVDTGLDIAQLCQDTAVASYRVLRDDRFGVYFYGMAYHQILTDALTAAGFTVDAYPFIWLRDRTAPPDGFARYSKTYDPALVASKGRPRFIRPNLPNSLAIPSVRGPERLHSAQKPVALMQKFIEDMTLPNCVVLDMFAGAGTTGVAALQTKRKVILFELEHTNCVIIKSRLGAL